MKEALLAPLGPLGGVVLRVNASSMTHNTLNYLPRRKRDASQEEEEEENGEESKEESSGKDKEKR